MESDKYLDDLVPSTGHHDGVLGVGGEPDTGDPVRVTVLLLDGVLADSQGVPQLDGLVSGARHDLTVVGGESNAQHILSVTNKTTGGLSTKRKIGSDCNTCSMLLPGKY